jgi:hypothetical protein
MIDKTISLHKVDFALGVLKATTSPVKLHTGPFTGTIWRLTSERCGYKLKTYSTRSAAIAMH